MAITTILSSTTTIKDQRKNLWQTRLVSALRTMLACSIVALTVLYGPERLRRIPTYPAFSYVTTILIVYDSTLGEALRGCCHALLALFQVTAPSILCLWLIGPERFTSGLAAAVVAVFTFAVAVPESTHILTKRIAFGQIVIVCVGTVVHGSQTGVVMHPIHVASSTILGCVASLLAVLLPYPRLAYYEVKKECRFYTENASERLNLFVKAFSAKDKTAAGDFMTEAKFLNTTGEKMLQNIKTKQEGILWERPHIRFQKPQCMDIRQKLEDLEIPMRGMELALTSCPSFPVGTIEDEMMNILQNLKSQIGTKLEQAKCYAVFNAKTAPETKKECIEESIRTLKPISSTKYMAPLFFFYSMQLLQNGLPIATEKDLEKKNLEKAGNSQIQTNWILRLLPSSQSLVFALKCSLSLSLAVIFGLIYNKKNGYWSGLTIAISFANKRQATFTVANARAQGTAMGSIYGILCCFIFQRFENYRFLALLPWIVFTSFLRHSRMYGEAGGISAVIGSLLILGRKNYGTPTEFGIARLTEATIGLLCFILVEILFQPARAAALAKSQLAITLEAIRDGIEDIITEEGTVTNISEMREKQKNIKICVDKFQGFVAEAELEPNFWFLPFNGTCYGKILKSFSRMMDLLLFAGYKVDFLSQVSDILGEGWKEVEEQINDDLELFRERVGYALKCLEEVILVKSLDGFSQDLKKKNMVNDIELGNSSDAIRSLGPDVDEVEEISISFLQLANEVAKEIDANEEDGEKARLKSQVVLCLNGLGFCVSGMMRETMEIEKEVRELIKWENPNRDINLFDISCKLNHVYTK